MMFPLPEIELTREYMLRVREAYLAIVDVYERILEINPRTSELRKAAKVVQLEKVAEPELRKEDEKP